MANERVDMFASTFEALIKATLGAAENVPADKRMKQAQEGKAHPLWQIGHLAFAFDTILNTLALGGAPELPGDYTPKFAPDFAGGKPITGKADDYPSWDEVVANYEKAGKTTIAKIRELNDSDLTSGAKGSPPDAMVDFFKVLGVTLGSMAGHDSYHRGQLNLIAALD